MFGVFCSNKKNCCCNVTVFLPLTHILTVPLVSQPVVTLYKETYEPDLHLLVPVYPLVM